jgi:hypothetical protein
MNTNTNTNMNSRIINTSPWGLHFNHNFDTKKTSYKYTGTYEECIGKSKRLKIFDTNVPELIPMDVDDDDDEEEEVGLVKQQRTLPPLRMETDTDSEEEEDMIAMPVLRRQTTCWINEDGITVYNGCPFGNRLMNK